jgi:hypothetical protein
MGLSGGVCAFLAAASRGGVSFERTLTVGRQRLLTRPRTLRAALREGGIVLDRPETLELVDHGRGYGESLLGRLGARTVDSLDASDFEGATLIHDLNLPMATEVRGQYSAVIDSGTLEHVFNFPVALAGCLESVALGGHYVAATPVNNFAGHGFYQFSPELYFRVLSEDNGFAVRCMLWRDELPHARWYEITDPSTVGRRVERLGAARSQIYVAAQRVELRNVLSEAPQQSDYVAEWSAIGDAVTGARPADVRSDVLHRIHKRAPESLKNTWRWLRWGGLPPALEETRSLVRDISWDRARRDDFRRVSLQRVTFE